MTTAAQSQPAYADPLDRVWIAAAERLGFRVERSPEVFASTDGEGTLIISEPAGFDPDDCLGQLILHELCHFLTQGEDSRQAPDWGLCNVGPEASPDALEYACLRFQRALLLPFGLESILGPTTHFRDWYETLGETPLDGDSDVHLRARAAMLLYETPRYRDAIEPALRATAAIARALQPFDTDSLWSRWRSVDARPPARHPFGFAWGPSDARCDDCAWARPDAGGRRRCVPSAAPTGPGRVVPEGQAACAHFLAELRCESCGACCRQAFDAVEVGPREAMAQRHRALLQPSGSVFDLKRNLGYCPAVVQRSADRAWRCAHYEDRPRSCADFERGSKNCLLARRRVGL